MTNVLTFNRGLAAGVSKELLAKLNDLRGSLNKTLPWENDVSDKFNKLSRIAKTAQLRGVEAALNACAAGSKKLAEGGSEDVLNHTLGVTQALLAHLQEVVHEHKNTPMKLARPIQHLNQALGVTVSPMLASEMYLPFMPEDTTAKRPTEISSADFLLAVTEHKAVYQAALVKMMKDGDHAQLKIMRQALITLEPKNPHVGYRVFFEAAIAAFDSFSKNDQLENATKWVVSKIEPELAAIVSGSTRAGESLLSTILYIVAKADPETGARTRKLQDNFGLRGYVAELTTVDPAVVDKFMSVLVKARELWSVKQDVQGILKITGDLAAKAAYLHNPGFTTAIAALHDVLSTIDREQLSVDAGELSLEGASALLVLEQQLREGSNPGMAQTLASRLYKLVGKNVDSGSSDKHAAASVLHQVASEIQEDLSQLEPRLLEMLNGQTDGEPDFRAGLVKIYKILRIFGKGNPLSEAFSSFEKNLKIEQTAVARADLAAQYTQLSTLVEHLKTSEKTAMTSAQKWLDNMTPIDQTNVPTQSADLDVPNDKEMLEIFLEEADGIVVDLGKWIKSLKVDPSEHDTLVNARRGYHTLKGSGRMVGLLHFGDMSYITELLLNNWVSSKKLASPELLQFLEDATARVSKHLMDFQTLGSSEVHYSDLEERAIALGGTALSDAPQSKKAKSAPVAQPAQPVVAEPITLDLVPTPAVEIEAPADLGFEIVEPEKTHEVELSFEMPEAVTAIPTLPDLPPLVDLTPPPVEAAPISMVIEPETRTPPVEPVVDSSPVITMDAPAPVQHTEPAHVANKPESANTRDEKSTVVKKKARATPAAWQTTSEKKMPERKPIEKKGPTVVARPSPVAPRPVVVQAPVAQEPKQVIVAANEEPRKIEPVMKPRRSIWKLFADWFSKVFGNRS